jgi:vitamin B12 transporter
VPLTIRTPSYNTRWFEVLLLLILAAPIGAEVQSNKPKKDIRFEEVIIVSSKVRVPLQRVGSAVSVISAEDIRLRAYHSVADILRTQPGIGTSNNGGSGKPTTLRIRGEEGYRTLVMIDGIELADPSRPQVGPAFEHLLTTNDVERIEILRGAQGFIYGADAGGVVNILTKAGAGPLSGGFNIDFGGFGTKKLDGNLAGGTEKTNFFISTSDFSSDGYNAKTSDTDLMDKDGYENKTLHTKFGWSPTNQLTLQLVARNTETKNKFDGCGFPTSNECSESSNQSTFKLSGIYASERFKHFLAVSGTDVDRSDFWAGIRSFATQGLMQRLAYTGTVEINQRSTLVYGLDMDKDEVVSNSGNVLERSQKGAYFEFHRKVGSSFFVTAGGRRDDNDDFGNHTSVRVSSAYLLNLNDSGTLKYRISYGTGFRAPSLYEIAYNDGPFASSPATNTPITEESSSGVDFGIEYTGASGAFFGATYFDQRIEDELFFDLAGYSGYLQSSGKNSSSGIELIAEYPITSQWTLFGNATLNETEDQYGLQRIRRPEQLANLGLKFSSLSEKASLFFNYRSSAHAIDELYGIGRVTLDDYWILDVSTTIRLNQKLEVYGRLENITDEDYEEVTGFRIPGLTVNGGIRLQF